MSVNSPKVTNYSSPFQSILNKFHSYSSVFPPNSRWTKQSFKDECDINTIMARYMSTGELPDISSVAPQYLDVTSGFDFQSMNDQVVEAKNLFSQLPSALRSRFANDPGAFLDYCADPENEPEMRKLGLLQGARGAGPGAPISSAPSALEDSAGGQSTPPSANPTPPKNEAK